MHLSKDLVADLSSVDLPRAERAVQELCRLSLEESLPILEKLLQGEDSETRWWATRALAELPDSAGADLLAKALRDESPAVRQCAALVARERPTPELVPALIGNLGAGDRLMARLAADALIALGEQATLALIKVLESADGAAQVEAARALAHIGDTRAIGPLFHALESGSAMVAHWANEGLERMGLGMRFFSPGG